MKKIFTAKRWKIMKICATQGLIAMVICGVSLAHDNYAQLLDNKVSIVLTEVSFDEALTKIADITQARFAYSPELLNVQDRITIISENKSLRQILTEMLEPRNISYHLHKDGVTISLKRKKSPDHSDEGKIGSAKLDNNPIPITAPITGTISDMNKQPIAGVNIVVKGSTKGTTSDANGKFSIEAGDSDILVFSFIGYAPQEIKVGNQTTFEIVLLEDVKSLDEVVINAGYWEVTEKEQTGNISRVTSNEIQKQPVSNPLQSMQGRMAGVYIQQNTGIPGGAFSIKIRGRNSLRADGNDPLYIVDGVPFSATALNSPVTSSIVRGGNPLTSINPGDIENIELLKDADATAIYGSRGSNGVVLITTKRGKMGRTKIDFNAYTGVGSVSNTMDLLNTQQYVDMRKEGLKNDGYWPVPSFLKFMAPDLFVYDTTRFTDWQQKLIGGKAHTSNAQLSISGGNANTQFLFGVGYYKEGTVFPGDFGYQRGSGNLHVNHTSYDNRFKVTASVNYTLSLNKLFPGDLTRAAVTLPPNVPSMHDAAGGINWQWANPYFQNPLIALQRKYNTTTDNLVANTTLSYEVIKGLNLKSSFGYTAMNVDEISTIPLSSFNPATLNGRTATTNFAEGKLKTWIVEPQADYTKHIGEGRLKVLLGASFQESIQKNQTIEATGYTSDALLENIKAATALNISNSSYSQYRYQAIFGRVNYSLKDRYILNLTGRRDGSSRFGPGKQFGNFGAAGIAWIFSNENFLKKTLPVLSFGKLRTSYGITGSDAIGNYQYLNTFSSTQYPYNGSSGLMVTRLSNADYSWESNKKFEVGMELGWLKDRIQLATSWFNNRSSNQLVGLPLPVLTGQSSVQFNLPATVENEGWEFQLNTINIDNDNFRWTTSINLTFPKNKLIEFPDLDAFPAYRTQYKVDESIFTRRTLKSTGINPETGLYTFLDANENGSISRSTDGLFLNEVSQKLFGGLNNGLSYKGIELDIFFQFVKQQGYNYLQFFDSPGAMSNQPVEVLQRWQQAGDQSSTQQFSAIGEGSEKYVDYIFSDKAISDASFIRLKNVSLSWQLPDRWMEKMKMTKLRIYVQGQNLLTFTKYVGLDPETQSSSSLPPLRMITGGIQITL
jgi:TonB-dependent starch-binding outer membrane protein SusC